MAELDFNPWFKQLAAARAGARQAAAEKSRASSEAPKFTADQLAIHLPLRDRKVIYEAAKRACLQLQDYEWAAHYRDKVKNPRAKKI